MEGHIKIVVPYDFSEMSLKSLFTARNMTQEPEHIWLVHVLDELAANDPGVVWGSEETSDKSRKEHVTKELKALLESHGLPTVRTEVRIGDPGEEITNFANEIGADLIVIASRGKTGLERILLGSVAESVVRHSHCSVYVLK